jgi:hypothetical protein
MTFRHAIASLAAVSLLAACSNGETIVSLNVSASDAVPVVDRLHVTIDQGSRHYVKDFAPPTDMPAGDAAPSIKNSFFQRLTLPDGWQEESATVHVEAQSATGAPFTPPLAADTTVTIVPEGVVAAFVSFDIKADNPDAGAGGAGGAGGASDSAGAGGDATNGPGAAGDTGAGGA